MRLYGRGYGHGSQARVTAGFRAELSRRGLLSGFFDLDDPEGQLESSEPGGADATKAVFMGPLNALWRMHFNAKHQRRYAMVAPNSSEIGKRLEKIIQENVDEVLTPSSWAASVLCQKLELPVTVVPHGVDPEFKPRVHRHALSRTRYEQGEFDVLHLSSSDRQRKGTDELIGAWSVARHDKVIPEKSRLALVVEEDVAQTLRIRYKNAILNDNIGIVTRLGEFGQGLAPADMSRFYQCFHLLVQPSRGEAFGMTPLEARACGVPVAATFCTGHSEHMSHGLGGVVVIEHGAEAPIDDLPGSVAPTVSEAAIVEALGDAFKNWPKLETQCLEHAPKLRNWWSWENVLEDWLTEMKHE